MEGRKGEIIKAILNSLIVPWTCDVSRSIYYMYYCITWWQWLQEYITRALYLQPISRILHCTDLTILNVEKLWRVIWTVIKLHTTLDLWVPRDHFLLRLTISQYVDIFINVNKGSENWPGHRRPSFRSECPPVPWLMNRQKFG